MEYAVRGPIVIRAVQIEKELAQVSTFFFCFSSIRLVLIPIQAKQYPFKNVIKANIGDAHAMGQQPITFIRQVIACTALPSLLESPEINADVKERAVTILRGCSGGSLGCDATCIRK